MGIVNKIHESYDYIFDLKKEFDSNVIQEAVDVYDNLNFENIGQGDPSKDDINTALLQDVQTAAKNAGVVVSITTGISGHEHLPSRHPSGNAVDIAKINGKSVSPSNKGDANKFVDALISMGYVKNQEDTNPKSVLTFGFQGHDNHVHVSNTTNQTSTPNSGSSGTSGSSSSSSSGSSGSSGTSGTESSNDDQTKDSYRKLASALATPILKSILNLEEKQRFKVKKLNENIDRIKGLLK